MPFLLAGAGSATSGREIRFRRGGTRGAKGDWPGMSEWIPEILQWLLAGGVGIALLVRWWRKPVDWRDLESPQALGSRRAPLEGALGGRDPDVLLLGSAGILFLLFTIPALW